VTNAELYLDLLKRVLTNTLFDPEPDVDASQAEFLVGFLGHYIRGKAISMLPLARMDNIEACVTSVVANSVPGDLIETGVWRGGATIFMRGILRTLSVTDRTVWVADSFEGLPEPDAERFPIEARTHRGVVMEKQFRHFAAGLEEVRANFETFGLLDGQVKFLKGWFKDSLPRAEIERLAVMRLDGDYYESTMDALVNLYHKLSPGGYVIVDDYGEDDWTNCRQAVDEFRTSRGITDELIEVDKRCFYWQRGG
jgi:Macrocin-O-methyltransferase (TylF)